MPVLTGELTVEVVLTDVDTGQLPERSKVERLVEGTLVGRAVAEERNRDPACTFPTELQRGAGRERDPTADDAVRTQEAKLGVDHVQRPALRAVVAVRARVELRVHARR